MCNFYLGTKRGERTPFPFFSIYSWHDYFFKPDQSPGQRKEAHDSICACLVGKMWWLEKHVTPVYRRKITWRWWLSCCLLFAIYQVVKTTQIDFEKVAPNRFFSIYRNSWFCGFKDSKYLLGVWSPWQLKSFQRWLAFTNALLIHFELKGWKIFYRIKMLSNVKLLSSSVIQRALLLMPLSSSSLKQHELK